MMHPGGTSASPSQLRRPALRALASSAAALVLSLALPSHHLSSASAHQDAGSAADYDALVAGARAGLKEERPRQALLLAVRASRLAPDRWEPLAIKATALLEACRTQEGGCQVELFDAQQDLARALTLAPAAALEPLQELAQAVNAAVAGGGRKAAAAVAAATTSSLATVVPKRIRSMDGIGDLDKKKVSCVFLVGDEVACPDGFHIGDRKFAGSIHVYSSRSGSLVRKIAYGEHYYHAVASNRAGTRVAAIRTQGKPRDNQYQLVVLESDTGRLVSAVDRVTNGAQFTLDSSFYDRPMHLIMSSGGQLVALAHGRTIMLFDASTGVRRAMLHASDAFTSIAFNAEASHLAAGNMDNDVWIIETASGAVSRKLSGHRDTVVGVTWGAVNLLSVSDGLGDGTGNVLLWDVSTGSVRAKALLAENVLSFPTHDDQFLGAGLGATLYALDASGVRPRASWLDDELCRHVAWNADGTQVVVGCSGDGDSTAWLLRLD